jgi:type I restriction enzyme R subunit
MTKDAHKLYYDIHLENPTIFFIVDRVELEEQLYTEFYALDIMQPEIIQSIADLQDVLEYDNYRGKRGIFITLIHKFRPDELARVQKQLEDISENRDTIMTRKNVIAFVDEGHRSQYGMLAAQMKAILKNAFAFALTGTPISKPKHGRDTYLEFAYPPDEQYLDRYFIVDSIRDGFTVKIVYQPHLENLHLEKEKLETFLEVELDEIPEQARSDVEEKLKQKLNPINVFLENQERIERIAEDIAGDFKKNVDGKFKAMIVAASRKACVYYKNALEKHLPDNYYAVVMTPESDERKDTITAFVREARVKYGGADFRNINKKNIENFKEKEYPKILIVTDMLLTGFDVPQLQVMYLDKPLKEHRLLQAIARTNRPYKGLKQAGIIIDYVGILKEFKRAAEFDMLIVEITQMFGDLVQNYERNILLKAVEVLTTDVSKEEEFIEKYRQLRKVFELLLGSDPYKLKHFEQYKWISAIYTYYMKMVMRGTSIDAYYVYKSTEIDTLEHDLPEVTFDADSLKKLEDKVKSREEKAANILFTLQRFVLVDKQKNPVFESLADRVQRLVDLWREKTKDYDRIYKEGAIIFDDIQILKSRQQKMGLSDMEYALLLTLEEQLQEGKNFADKIRDLYSRLQKSMFPGWSMQATVSKAVEQEVRKFVRQMKSEHKLSMDDMDKLYDKLISKVISYGS